MKAKVYHEILITFRLAVVSLILMTVTLRDYSVASAADEEQVNANQISDRLQKAAQEKRSSIKMAAPMGGNSYAKCSEFFSRNISITGKGFRLSNDGALSVPRTARHSVLGETNIERFTTEKIEYTPWGGVAPSLYWSVLEIERESDKDFKKVTYISCRDEKTPEKPAHCNHKAYDFAMKDGKCVVHQVIEPSSFIHRSRTKGSIIAHTPLCSEIDNFFKNHPYLKQCSNQTLMRELLTDIRKHEDSVPIAVQERLSTAKSKIREYNNGQWAFHTTPYAIASALLHECEDHALDLFYDDFPPLNGKASSNTTPQNTGGNSL